MIIRKKVTAWEQLNSFASEEWDKVGDLVKFVLDNGLESYLDVAVAHEFTDATCDEDEFHEWCVSGDAMEYLRECHEQNATAKR